MFSRFSRVGSWGISFWTTRLKAWEGDGVGRMRLGIIGGAAHLKDGVVIDGGEVEGEVDALQSCI